MKSSLLIAVLRDLSNTSQNFQLVVRLTNNTSLMVAIIFYRQFERPRRRGKPISLEIPEGSGLSGADQSQDHMCLEGSRRLQRRETHIGPQTGANGRSFAVCRD